MSKDTAFSESYGVRGRKIKRLHHPPVRGDVVFIQQVGKVHPEGVAELRVGRPPRVAHARARPKVARDPDAAARIIAEDKAAIRIRLAVDRGGLRDAARVEWRGLARVRHAEVGGEALQPAGSPRVTRA